MGSDILDDYGSIVIVGGIVSSFRTVVARNGRNAGKRLGIVTLEDLKGRIEAVVFPKELPTYHALLVPDALLFLEGTVDRKRENPSLRVSRVVLAENAIQELAKTLLADIAKDGPVEKLVALMREHRGECRVYLNVATDDDLCAQIECHPSFNVACSPEFLEAIVTLLGSDAIHILGPTKRSMPLAGATTPARRVAVTT